MSTDQSLYPRIVRGVTYHKRHGAIHNAFRYGVNYVLLPMEHHKNDHKDQFYLFSHNRANIISFQDKDHGSLARDLSSKSQKPALWAQQIAQSYGIPEQKRAHLWLLTQPRVAGYVFNPVSFWFFCDEKNSLHAVLAEVNNTFGDRHSYLCFHEDGSPIAPEHRIKAQKVFHVSPFQDVEGEYSFRFSFCPEKVGVWINYKRADGGLYATLTGASLPMSDWNLLKMLLKYPFGAMRVIGLIHWQALKLALKGTKYRRRPLPPIQEVTK